MNLNSIKANVNAEKIISGDVKINSTPTIEKVTEKKIDAKGEKKVVLVDFKYETKYEPDIGEVIMNGNVIYTSNNIDEVVELWKKNKNLGKHAVDILNAIFRKCIIQTLFISGELRLPPPIQLPVVKSEENKE